MTLDRISEIYGTLYDILVWHDRRKDRVQFILASVLSSHSFTRPGNSAAIQHVGHGNPVLSYELNRQRNNRINGCNCRGMQ